MKTKSFVLRRDTYSKILPLCDEETIAVVRPEKYVENLFRDLINAIINKKQLGQNECQIIREYFNSFSEDINYRKKVSESLDSILAYLNAGVSVYVKDMAIEDYILDKCAFLCAEAVGMGVPESVVVNGNELVICKNDAQNPVFDWDLSQKAISEKCGKLKKIIISGGMVD